MQGRQRHNQHLNERGFSLLEVMICLFLLAVVATALSHAIGRSAIAVNLLEQRFYSRLTAHNMAAELFLKKESIPEGETQGVSTMGKQHFTWNISTQKISDSGLVRTDIQVNYPQNKEKVYSLSVFFGGLSAE